MIDRQDNVPDWENLTQSGADKRKFKASELFHFVTEPGVAIGFEKSFKIFEKTLLANRFLLGMSKKEFASREDEEIVRICERLAMPGRLLDLCKEHLGDANYIHFGFEEDLSSCMFKVYLEFWETINNELNDGTRSFEEPQLLHLGFKWDPLAPEKTAVTKYLWYPWLSGEQIMKRICALVDPVRHRHLREGAGELIQIGLTCMHCRDILYLEVTEEGNPRASFDINVYRGSIAVGELYPLLCLLGQHYSIPHGEFHRFYDSIKAKKLGHLSAGIGRNGKDFCTFYYGVEPLSGRKPSFSEYVKENAIGQDGGRDLPRHAIEVRQAATKSGPAALLLEEVKKLDIPFGFERSFKIAHGTFLPERFLIGFRNSKNDCKMRNHVMEITRRIGMPDDFRGRFEIGCDSADMILLGFEKNGKGHLYKAYLEFNQRLERAFRKDPFHPSPFPMFEGFKWDASDCTRKVVTRYTCFPSFLLRDMAAQVSRILGRNPGNEAEMIVKTVLDLASHRAGPGDFLYYEADEEGNARKSFSINLYRAGLCMMEIYPLLIEAARYYSLSMKEFTAHYESFKPQVLGNLAGGIDRDGGDFMTFYFSHRVNAGLKTAQIRRRKT
jgi:hypothetical protein